MPTSSTRLPGRENAPSSFKSRPSLFTRIGRTLTCTRATYATELDSNACSAVTTNACHVDSPHPSAMTCVFEPRIDVLEQLVRDLAQTSTARYEALCEQIARLSNEPSVAPGASTVPADATPNAITSPPRPTIVSLSPPSWHRSPSEEVPSEEPSPSSSLSVMSRGAVERMPASSPIPIRASSEHKSPVWYSVQTDVVDLAV